MPSLLKRKGLLTDCFFFLFSFFSKKKKILISLKIIPTPDSLSITNSFSYEQLKNLLTRELLNKASFDFLLSKGNWRACDVLNFHLRLSFREVMSQKLALDKMLKEILQFLSSILTFPQTLKMVSHEEQINLGNILSDDIKKVILFLINNDFIFTDD